MLSCIGCNIAFTPKRKNQKYHSKKCYQNKTVKLKSCPQCGIEFKRKFSDQKCCTPKCGFAYRAKNKIKGSDIPCSFCGKPVYKMKSRQRKDNFCNNDCKYAWLLSDKNPYKKRKHTFEEKEKIRLAGIERDYSKLSKFTREKFRQIAKKTINRPEIVEKTKKINSERLKGTILSEEQKQKIKNSSGSRESHKDWKGPEASYAAKHMDVAKYKGRPTFCVDCGVTSQERIIQWSNIDGLYSRNLDDYEGRCVPCHRKYDTYLKIFRLFRSAWYFYIKSENMKITSFTIDGIIVNST